MINPSLEASRLIYLLRKRGGDCVERRSVSKGGRYPLRPRRSVILSSQSVIPPCDTSASGQKGASRVVWHPCHAVTDDLAG